MTNEGGGQSERAPAAHIFFGAGGHEGEYVLALEDFTANKYIPRDIETALQQALGEDWRVENRGSRIEIHHRRDYGKRDDTVVHSAVADALRPLGYRLETYP